MYFVAIVLFVYNDFCFPLISLCDHCVVLVKFVADVFAMCECLLCVTLELWLALCICFRFLVAMRRLASWNLGSSNFMACSVSRMKLVQ